MLEEIREDIMKQVDKNPELEPFGHYILKELLTSEAAAARISEVGKSLGGCYSEIKEKAKKQAHGGCAMIHGTTVFGWIRKYYGFGGGSGADDETAKSTGRAATPVHMDLLDLI